MAATMAEARELVELAEQTGKSLSVMQNCRYDANIRARPLILDMAIHTFDQARFTTGPDPVSVYCQEYNPPGSWYAGNASAICIYKMSDGTVFCYRGSWCAEGAADLMGGVLARDRRAGPALWDGVGAPYDLRDYWL